MKNTNDLTVYQIQLFDAAYAAVLKFKDFQKNTTDITKYFDEQYLPIKENIFYSVNQQSVDYKKFDFIKKNLHIKQHILRTKFIEEFSTQYYNEFLNAAIAFLSIYGIEDIKLTDIPNYMNVSTYSKEQPGYNSYYDNQGAAESLIDLIIETANMVDINNSELEKEEKIYDNEILTTRSNNHEYNVAVANYIKEIKYYNKQKADYEKKLSRYEKYKNIQHSNWYSVINPHTKPEFSLVEPIKPKFPEPKSILKPAKIQSEEKTEYLKQVEQYHKNIKLFDKELLKYEQDLKEGKAPNRRLDNDKFDKATYDSNVSQYRKDLLEYRKNPAKFPSKPTKPEHPRYPMPKPIEAESKSLANDKEVTINPLVSLYGTSNKTKEVMLLLQEKINRSRKAKDGNQYHLLHKKSNGTKH